MVYSICYDIYITYTSSTDSAYALGFSRTSGWPAQLALSWQVAIRGARKDTSLWYWSSLENLILSKRKGREVL